MKSGDNEDRSRSERAMSDSRKPRAGTVEPYRSQVVIRFEMPELILPSTHRARAIDQVVGTLDLSGFTFDSTSVEQNAGRSTLRPRMMLTLWLYAISEGIGSARESARRIVGEDAVCWTAGKVAVSHQSLSSFRVGHGAVFDRLLTDVSASLSHKGLLSLDLVAQDGTRVRNDAVVSSTRIAARVSRAGGVAPQGGARGRRSSGAHRGTARGTQGCGLDFTKTRRGGDCDGRRVAKGARRTGTALPSEQASARIDDGR